MASSALPTLRTQVLVIGSGAGGAVTASTLASAGFDVCVAEEGQHHDTSKIATHSPLGIRRLFRHGGIEPILGNCNIAFVEGRCVGGSTEINSAVWQRTPPEALARWAKTFRVRELSGEDLEPLFDELERALLVSRLNDGPIPRSSEVFKLGSEALGWAVQEMPRAQRTDLATSQFAPGARMSMARTFIPAALEAGARLVTGCRVLRLEHRQGRVSGAWALVEQETGPRPLKIEADTVFVCCGPIHTPALLRMSGIKRNVGESLRIHPMIKAAGLFPETLDSHMAPLPVYQVTQFLPEIMLGGSIFSPGYLALALSERWPESMETMRSWRRMALFYAACRGSGLGTVRVIPRLHSVLVRYDVTREDQLHLTAGLARLAELLLAAGAVAVYPALRVPAVLRSVEQCRALLRQPLPLSGLNLTTVHAFSSCPMGEDVATCATDSFGRVHGYANLYVNDASLLPDSPSVNPQGTTMAIALRNARWFAAEHRPAG